MQGGCRGRGTAGYCRQAAEGLQRVLQGDCRGLPLDCRGLQVDCRGAAGELQGTAGELQGDCRGTAGDCRQLQPQGTAGGLQGTASARGSRATAGGLRNSAAFPRSKRLLMHNCHQRNAQDPKRGRRCPPKGGVQSAAQALSLGHGVWDFNAEIPAGSVTPL